MTKAGLALLAPVVLLAGCGNSADRDAVIETVRTTEQSQLQSIESRDLVGVARLYADDARLVRPDGTVLEGGVAIVEEYDRLLADPNFAIDIEPQQGWASSGDDLAVVTSRVSFTTTDPETGEPTTMPLNSQTVWTRQTGGTWKIVSAYNVAVEDEMENASAGDAQQAQPVAARQ